MTLTWLLILTGALSGAAAGSRTFHVDARRGDDAQDGLQPETAWRSLDKVNRAALIPGDRVLFRRGQTWRGQLIPRSGDASGSITYGAFGEGAKPLLLGSVSFGHLEGWHWVGESIWATAPPRFEAFDDPIALPPERWWIHQEGDADCTMNTRNQESEGAAVLVLTCRQPGIRTHHIQLSSPGLTLQEGVFYLFTFRARASRAFTPASITLMKGSPPWTSYARLDTPLPTIGTNWAERTLRFHAGHSARDARLTVFLGGAMQPGTTMLLQPIQLIKARGNQAMPLSIDVGNIIFDHGRAIGVKKWREADLRREGDYFYDADSWQVKLCWNGNPAARHQSIELALRRHIIDQTGCGHVTYENLDLRYGAAHGIGGGNTRHIIVRGCDLSYIGGGHQFTRPDGTPVRYGNGIEFWSGARACLVEDCHLGEIYDAALTNQGDGTNVQENITYRRNVIWNSEYSFEYWNRGPASRTDNIVFEHNTCVDAGYGWGHGQRPDPNGRHLMFYDNSAATSKVVIRHNIFSSATDSCLRLSGRDWTAALAMDYNCWFQPEGALLLWGQTAIGAGGFAAFMHQRGFGNHSIVADPKFDDPAQRDYHLRPDSPARALSNGNQPVGALP